METIVNFRMPGDLIKKLNHTCIQLQRSKSFVLRKALEQYLSEYVDYQIALDRFTDKDDCIITAKKMGELLGKKR